MDSDLKVLFASTEVNPLAKVGGLADVAGALPQALRRLRIDVRVAMPHYSFLDDPKYFAQLVANYSVTAFGRAEDVRVSRASLRDGTPVYLLGNQTYLDRKSVYGEKDDLDRFVFLSIAVSELPGALGWWPDVLHCHDWHTGLAPVLWRKKHASEALRKSVSVFTIHNLGYQGKFDEWFAGRAALHEFLPNGRGPHSTALWSLMGLAISSADAISTVSPTYAREILTAEQGFGLQDLLQERRSALFGILNGVDYEEFDPARDRLLPFRYGPANPEGKEKNKIALQQMAGLELSPLSPVAGMVGRLADQKGLDLVAAALEELLKETDIQFILLGSGDEKYRKALDELSGRYPTRMCLMQGFDAPAASLIYAGADIFLMPSRYEPCGLGQMIALRYGTIPVVRQTGGLADSIQDYTADPSSGNGFVFKGYHRDEFIEALRRADGAYHDKEKWAKLVARGMKADFSWDASAIKYVEMYRIALGR
ncbi:MAG: glycogen synthase [Chloroflexi bacterium]|nr:glycogen synthase [Chloroflexota bacterium]